MRRPLPRGVALVAMGVVLALQPRVPARAETATIDGKQGASPNHTVMTVTPDVAGPGDVLHIDVDASYLYPEIRCGVAEPDTDFELGSGVDFFPASGSRPATDEIADSLFSLPATPQVIRRTTTHEAGCDARHGTVTHIDVAMPTAEELRGFGLTDGPVRLFPIGGFYSRLADPSPIRFTSGDVPKITVRGLTAPAALRPVREVGSSVAAPTSRSLGALPVAAAVAALLGAASLHVVAARRRSMVTPGRGA